MTLARSHQQQLNGNKIFLVIFSLFMLITSCGAGKRLQTNQTNKQQTEYVEINSKRDSVAKHTVPVDILDLDNNTIQIDSATKINTNNTTLTEVKNNINNVEKNEYRIAVVLPFILNQIPLSGVYVNDSTKQLVPDSKKAMDFYLGCKLAKQEIQSYNKNVNVYFIDDKNSAEEMSNLTSSPALKNADYIIAPFNSAQVFTLADFAKANQKIIFSPTTNSIYSVKNNPFFYSVTPTLYAQYQKLIQEIQSKQPNATIEIIYNEKDSVSEKISFLKNIISKNSTYPNKNINFNTYNFSSLDDVAKKMQTSDTTSERVILILSSNENYIKTIINKLAIIKNKLHIYTNSTVRFSKSLVNAKSFKHSLYTLYAYNTNTNTKLFNQKYKDNFVKEPTELSYLGYDIFKYLISKIDNSESLLVPTDTPYQEYLQSEFNFVPSTNSSGTIDYYDNISLSVFKWSNGQFVKM